MLDYHVILLTRVDEDAHCGMREHDFIGFDEHRRMKRYAEHERRKVAARKRQRILAACLAVVCVLGVAHFV